MADCHGEVLARRAFLRFLLELVKSDSKLITKTKRGFSLNFEVHFYSSSLPCGDCAIIPMDVSGEPVAKRAKTGRLDDFRSELSQTQADIFRTGAKPVNGEDPKMSGTGYHRLGIGRTKGGRGHQSWSMSCSGRGSDISLRISRI